MNKAVRTMKLIIGMNFCSPEMVMAAECFNEEVEAAFSTESGSSGAKNELAIEQDNKHLYIPFIAENYRFFRYILEMEADKLSEQKIQAIFGDIAVVTDGSSSIIIIDANPAHGGGIVFKMEFSDLRDRMSHIVMNAEG